MPLTPKEKFLHMIANEVPKPSDAIVILEGDGLARIPEGARLHREGYAPLVVLSGGVVNPPHSIHADEMLPHLIQAGVPEGAIIVERASLHTRAQGEEVMKLAKEREWKSVIIVASHYHQYRAYLTFLRAMQDAEMRIAIYNAPARALPWFIQDAQGRRIDLLEGEFERIEKYFSEGHIASYEDALEHQEWKESLG